MASTCPAAHFVSGSAKSPSCSSHARRAMRHAEPVPILERLRDKLDRLTTKLLPKSALALAVTYAINPWRALCRYTEDGRPTFDNNVSERRLRDQAIGRKNWMFLGNDEAGPRPAVAPTLGVADAYFATS